MWSRLASVPALSLEDPDTEGDEVTRASTAGGNSRPVRTTSPRRTTNDTGAYTKLIRFIKSVQEERCEPISEDKFRDLMESVEALSSQGEGQKVSAKSLLEHSRSCGQKDFEGELSVLHAMGVAVDSQPPQKDGYEDLTASQNNMLYDHHMQYGAASVNTSISPAGRISGKREGFMQHAGLSWASVDRLGPYLEDEDEEVADQPSSSSKKTVLSYKSQHLEECLSSANFDPTSLIGKGDGQQDIKFLLFMFKVPMDTEDTDSMIDRYNLDEALLANWIEAIRGQYLNNPYHNWGHAVDVTQFIFFLLVTGRLSRLFNYQDLLVLLCAAIAHDTAHPGLTNLYLSRVEDDLALVYNDRSPLEHMHACRFFQTLSKERNNFLIKAKKHGASNYDSFSTFREKVIGAILATDMVQHKSQVDRFTARVDKPGVPFLQGTKSDPRMKKESKTDRRLLLEATVHLADLSHCTRDFGLNQIWVQRLEEEWFLQGDLERERALAISPGCDRHKDSLATLQSFFMGHFIVPLLTPFMGVLNIAREGAGRGKEKGAAKPAVDLPDFLGNVENNMKNWADACQKYGNLSVKEMRPKFSGESQGQTTSAEAWKTR